MENKEKDSSKNNLFVLLKNIIKSNEIGIFLVTIAIFVILSLVNSNFCSAYNVAMVIRQFSFIAIVAIGQTIVLISGGMDLSVGSTAGLCGILSAWMMVHTGINPFLCVIIGILIGALCGAFNGLLIAKAKLNPFVVTLATGSAYGGLIMVITEGYAIMDLPKNILFLGQGMIGPVPVPVILMIIIAVIFYYILKDTPFGRHVYAIGGNQSAAKFVGIKLDKVKIGIYTTSGILSAIAGILFVCRLATGQPTIGQEWVMPTITAAILGGTSLTGGEGGVVGTIIGAALMGIISNAIVILHVSAYWQDVITGAIVLLAVGIDKIRINMRKD